MKRINSLNLTETNLYIRNISDSWHVFTNFSYALLMIVIMMKVTHLKRLAFQNKEPISVILIIRLL